MMEMVRSVQILLVEDSSSDAHWMKLALDELQLKYSMPVLENGEQAVDYILQRGAYANAPRPDIIFLDINLPRITGVEVLRAVWDHGEFPICIVSGSRLEQNYVREHFTLDARCYMVKPVNREALLEAFSCFDHLKPIADELRNLPGSV